jgi:tetratricopeptide (TPR) repeat protein
MVETISPSDLRKEAERAYKQKDYLSAAKSYQAAAECYSQPGEQITAAELLNNASVAYLQAGEPEAALQATLDTEITFSEAGDTRRQAIALGNQAAAYETLGQFESAADAYKTSSELLKKIDDQELRSVVMQSLSAVQLRLGNKMEALVTMQAGLEQIENPGLKQKLVKKILRSPFSYFNRLT